MVIAVFKGSDIARVYDLWQWDYGQKLRIQGLDLPTAVEIHFSLTESSGESITRVGNTVDGVTDVIIPDSMLENETALQSTYNIYAFIYLTDDTSGETVKKIVMEVKTRPKPEAFDAPEDAELFRKAIQAVNDAADRAKVSETNASDSAASAQSDAAKTTADRLEVERLVQSVSGIEDEVKVVEQYKEQAIQAAQTAGTSEQNAKASETAAQVAQKAAESAKALTEQYKTAAAESANVATQAASNAEGSARAAEQSASQTARIAQAAVQNIEQAGSDQVNAVNDAGESQKQAVNAVGTSQVEAVTNAGAAQVEEVNSAGEEKVEEIQQKGQQILDSIPQDYNTAMAGKLDKQQGTENAGKVMTVGEDGSVAPTDAPQGMTTEQKQQLDKATADIKDLYNTKANAIMDTLTGNPVVLKTAGEGLGVEIEMQGWTEQNQYEGKNLLSNNPMDWMMNKNISWGAMAGTPIGFRTDQKYASIFVIHGVKNNTKYSFKNLQKEKLWLSRIVQADENGIGYVNIALYVNESQNYSEYSFTITNENVTTLYVAVRTVPESGVADSVDITEDDIRNMQICLSEGDPMYEPYTGNAPSPSPEYPQEIVHAGRYNEETQKYEVEVKIIKNNLFDENKYKFQDGYYVDYNTGKVVASSGVKVTMDFVPIEYFYSDNITFNLSNADDKLRVCFYDKSQIYLSGVNNKNSMGIPQGASYYKFSCDSSINEIMINNGMEYLPYEEYKEQTVKVTSDRPITKWDRLVEKDGQIGWEYGCREKILDGTEEFICAADSYVGENSCNCYFSVSNKVKDLPTKQNGFCNILTFGSTTWSTDLANDSFCYNSTNQIHVRLTNKRTGLSKKSSRVEVQETFKRFFTDNSGVYKFLYKLEQKEFVPLPSEEQEALRDLKTYYPTSIISNDQECPMDVTYAMDTKTYIDKKFEELQSALVTTNSILLGGE